MTCVSAEGTFKRHLFTIREHGLVRWQSAVCLRCGKPRRKPADGGRVTKSWRKRRT